MKRWWLLKLYPLLAKRPKEQQDDFVKSTYRLREDGLLHYNWDTNIALALQKKATIRLIYGNFSVNFHHALFWVSEENYPMFYPLRPLRKWPKN